MCVCGFVPRRHSEKKVTISAPRLVTTLSRTGLTHPALSLGEKAPRALFFFISRGRGRRRGSSRPTHIRVAAGGGTRRAYLTWAGVSGVLFAQRAESGEPSVGEAPTFLFVGPKFGNVTHTHHPHNAETRMEGKKNAVFFPLLFFFDRKSCDAALLSGIYVVALVRVKAKGAGCIEGSIMEV